MSVEQPKSCLTHAELSAEFRAHKELTKVLFDERKAFVDERFSGVDRALTAIKEATNLAFSNSEKAIAKQETSQREYNVGHNDLSRKMENQYKDMLPRVEFDRMFTAINEKIEEIKKEISGLRESRSMVSGKSAGISAAWAVIVGIMGILGGGGLIGVMLLLFKK